MSSSWLQPSAFLEKQNLLVSAAWEGALAWLLESAHHCMLLQGLFLLSVGASAWLPSSSDECWPAGCCGSE